MEELRQIFDRAFKRLFSLSNAAVISLINGLFGTDHPPDSSVVYTNRESTNASLRHRFADVFVLIGGRFHYHLEAQMSYSNDIVVRVFEYGFHHALESHRDGSLCLEFPEPVVIYLCDRDDIPPEDVLHIHFQGLGSIDYRVRNIVYLRQSSAEILQKKLIVLIPFQVLRLRSLLFDRRGRLKRPDKNECDRLIESIESDIIKAINLNYSAGNISYTDMLKLYDIAGQLYDQIILHYRKKGGDYTMRPLLPGALRLPNDKYIFQLEELEDKYAEARKTIAIQGKTIATQEKDNATLSDEIEKLKARIRELESAFPR